MQKGFEIPICVSDLFAIPGCGNYRRLAMDAVVNKTWLAFHWAKEGENDDAVSALKALILD